MGILKRYWPVFLFIILGIITLLPASTRNACYLGYCAYCSFIPISTILLWGLAGYTYWRIVKESSVKKTEDKE